MASGDVQAVRAVISMSDGAQPEMRVHPSFVALDVDSNVVFHFSNVSELTAWAECILGQVQRRVA